MRWEEGRKSENVEDRRGSRPQQLAIGGGAGILIMAVIALLLGKNPLQLLNELGRQGQLPGGGGAGDGQFQETPETARLATFVKTILGSTEDIWRAQFQQLGKQYVEPKLVLFADGVQSACGLAQSAMGPFYCPADQKVYIDLSFYNDLKERHNAPGDFAQAYVIAHEVGHHIQNLLGTSDRVHEARQQVSEAEYNKLSVRLELQADFLAGLWAHHAQKRSQELRVSLEPGDLEEALNAASAIGDDRLQREARGHVVPDSFTHGTSAQRVRWFRKGFETGDFRQGDTFNARDL